MKKIKKILTICLGTAVIAAALNGCGSSSSGSESQAAQAEGAETENTENTENASAATDFPKKDITIVVPYDAGGGVDLTTRVLTDTAGKDYFNGHSLIVQNMGGGGGSIGQTYVANAEADGYTLLAYTSSVVNNPQLKEVTFDYTDFKTLGMVCFDPEILLVPTTAAYADYDEFLAYAKENTVKVSTSGATTSHHIFGIRLAELLGVSFDYIHCDSASIQKEQLLGGHCDAAIFPLSEIQSEIQDGSVIPIAIATEERDASVPDVPTFRELGVDIVDGAFRGFAVPADVPDEVYTVLRDTIDEIITSDAFIEGMETAGIPYTYKNAEDFQAYAEECSVSLKGVVDLLK